MGLSFGCGCRYGLATAARIKTINQEEEQSVEPQTINPQAGLQKQENTTWAIWPDRATADTAHKGMFEDTQMAALSDMPFDGKRMILGGFQPMLHFHKSDLDLV
ncbi:MAG: hypothetical protein CMQ07_01180 [Gammaproteobacteria bacterium]|nr:hypothetical protein [Gammaproteobacteria bacterium]